MPASCPACHAENAPDARRCQACGAALARPRRRRNAVEDTGSTLGSRATNRAFFWTALGLIPGLGLVCGPVGVALAVRAYQHEKAGPPPPGRSPALAVLTFAAAIGVTNWVGVALMIYGLTSAAGH